MIDPMELAGGMTVAHLLNAHLVASSATAPAPCLAYGWSISGSAPTDSTFAGVLAGFVFLGVATLITRKDPRNSQALGLLSCAFVVLGFDSYLFSLLSGSANDTDCARLWAEFIPASGMLAVGGLAVVTGMSWLLAMREGGEVETAAPHLPDSGEAHNSGATLPAMHQGPTVKLDGMSRFMAHAVAVGVALLLTSTALDYGQIAFEGRRFALIETVAIIAAGAVASSVIITILRNRSAGRADNAVETASYVLSSYGMLVYAIACTVFVGYITNTNAGDSPVAIVAVILGLVAPAILQIALVQSAAPNMRASKQDTRSEANESPPTGTVPVTSPPN
jgi:hypothetical protein